MCAVKRLTSTAEQVISAECKASIRAEFPGEFLKTKLFRIRQIANTRGEGGDAARTAWKLLNRAKYKK
jgi:hypothetical protein